MIKRGKRSPGNLSKEGKKLWAEIVGGYSDFDDYGCLILKVALEAYDRLQAARVIIDEEGETIKTPTGYVKEHPCLRIEIAARNGFIAAIRLLNLNIEPSGEIGRPPGS